MREGSSIYITGEGSIEIGARGGITEGAFWKSSKPSSSSSSSNASKGLIFC